MPWRRGIGPIQKQGENVNKALLLGGALALVLTACASQTIYTEANPRLKGYVAAFAPRVNPTDVYVLIVEDKIVVDQEPVRPPTGDPVVIFFSLPDGGNYSFKEHGIEIKGHPNFCNPVSDYVFKCKYSRPAPDTIYKYAVRVKKGGGGTIKDLDDPSIWN
jgi:hypothetical protein